MTPADREQGAGLREPRVQGPRVQGPRVQGPRVQGPRLLALTPLRAEAAAVRRGAPSARVVVTGMGPG
ncbi:MAG: hypothetical protein ACRDZQ_08815, partial [Acidimicrobiales bacterium]